MIYDVSLHYIERRLIQTDDCNIDITNKAEKRQK